MCVKNIGKSCKKERPCTPVPGGCLDDRLQILDNLDTFSAQHADFMLANDYIDSLYWQNSFDLCKAVHVARTNEL